MLACDLIIEVRAARSVSAEQVAGLEHSMPLGGTVSEEMLDFLFTIDRYAERAAPAWTQLLARAVLSAVVLGEAPSGVLTEDKADWLIGKIGNDRIASMRSLELLARVMARSASSPAWLQELLVELSGRNHQAAPQAGARALQAVLAETYPSGPSMEPPEQAPHTKVVPLPAPIPEEIPIAAAA